MITTSEGFEAFSKQALDRFCAGLAEHTKQHGRLPEVLSVGHFLVQRDPETGEELERPALRQLEWLDMGAREVQIAAAHFAKQVDAMAVVFLRLELCPPGLGRVVMHVQHQEGALDAAVDITVSESNGQLYFGVLQELDGALPAQYDPPERESHD